MQSPETQITMVKWTNAGGQTKGANEQSFVYRPPVWRRWGNVKTTYSLEDCVKVSLLDKTKETAQRVCPKIIMKEWKWSRLCYFRRMQTDTDHIFSPFFCFSTDTWKMKKQRSAWPVGLHIFLLKTKTHRPKMLYFSQRTALSFQPSILVLLWISELRK